MVFLLARRRFTRIFLSLVQLIRYYLVSALGSLATSITDIMCTLADQIRFNIVIDDNALFA